MGNLSFNAKRVAPGGEFEPLAAGEYHLAVLKSEVVANKSGEGSHVLLTLQVQDGPHRGRLVWDRVTFTKPSEEAVRIGHERLSAYCHATGLVKAIKDTSELHGIPFRARVGVEDGRNVVTRVLWKEGPVDLAALHLPARPTAVEGGEAGQS
jgi:hypothetical protein